MKIKESFQESFPVVTHSALSEGWFPGRQPAKGDDEDLGSAFWGEAWSLPRSPRKGGVKPATLTQEALS